MVVCALAAFAKAQGVSILEIVRFFASGDRAHFDFVHEQENVKGKPQGKTTKENIKENIKQKQLRKNTEETRKGAT